MENALLRLILTVSERGYLEFADLDILRDARTATLQALSSRREQVDKPGEQENEQNEETDARRQSEKRPAPAELEDVRKRLRSAVKTVTPITNPPSNIGSSSSTGKRRLRRKRQVPSPRRDQSPEKFEVLTNASPEFFKEFKMPELAGLSQWVPKCQASHQERVVPSATRKVNKGGCYSKDCADTSL